MVCRGLRTIDKLNAAKEKEKQTKLEQVAIAAMLSSSLRPNALALGAKNNPFASLEVPLLPPKV
jgi:hypothetical protein